MRGKRRKRDTALLTLLLLNVRGVSNKGNEWCQKHPGATNVESWLEEADADITVLQETKLGPDDKLRDHMHLGRAQVHLANRNRHGGGVAVIVKDGTPTTPRPDLERLLEPSGADDATPATEAVVLELYRRTRRNVILVAVYLPPRGKKEYTGHLARLDKVLEAAKAEKKEVLVVGDLNARHKAFGDTKTG